MALPPGPGPSSLPVDKRGDLGPAWSICTASVMPLGADVIIGDGNGTTAKPEVVDLVQACFEDRRFRGGPQSPVHRRLDRPKVRQCARLWTRSNLNSTRTPI